MSTKEEVKQEVATKNKYPDASRRYLKRNYKKVLEIQRRYREANPEKSREWRREAQRRFYKKNKDKQEYQATKYYSNLKSSFKRYVFNYAEQEELKFFLKTVVNKRNGVYVGRPVLIPLDDKEVQKLRTMTYRFIVCKIKPKDYDQKIKDVESVADEKAISNKQL